MNKIKAIIFDLDDTLADTSGTVKEKIVLKALKSINLESEYAKYESLQKQTNTRNAIKQIAKQANKSDEEIDKALNVYLNDQDIEGIKLFDGAKEVLENLKNKYYLSLVTFGNKERQRKKILELGISSYFDTVHIVQEDNKTETYYEIRNELGILPQSIAVVGNKVESDLTPGKNIGFLTILIRGSAKQDTSKPDYVINTVSDLPLILNQNENKAKQLKQGAKITLLGGGTGVPTLIEGLKQYTENINAIIATTDRGRSSGKLHQELGVLPPGDIRNNIIALSDSEKLLQDLFQYRFDEGSLKGHTIGNLFIAGLAKMQGSFEKAIESTSKIFNLKGKIIPVTSQTTEICAKTTEGDILKGEQAIVLKGEAGKNDQRGRIEKAWLEPDVEASSEAVKKIKESDIVVIGPGSLYTSVIAPLLHKNIKQALQETNAKIIYVCNIVTHPGQSREYTASMHAEDIQKHIGKVLNYVIVNTSKPKETTAQSYEEENSKIVEIDEALHNQNYEVIEADLIEDVIEKKILWEKDNLLRHDSEKIAKIINGISRK